MSCLFPACQRHPEKNGYCIGHRIYANSTEIKMPKEISKASDKMKEVKKNLRKMYAEFLSKPENKKCKVKMKGCLWEATVIHHVRGRNGDHVFEQKDWMPSCIWCNCKLEEQDALAREKGVKKSKFNNN